VDKQRFATSLWGLVVLALVSPVVYSKTPDPGEPSQRYSSKLKTLRSEDDVLKFVVTDVIPHYGLENALLTFSQGVAGGSYTKQVEQLLNIPRMKWNADWGMLGRYELEDM
jgi:hypothetical protein